MVGQQQVQRPGLPALVDASQYAAGMSFPQFAAGAAGAGAAANGRRMERRYREATQLPATIVERFRRFGQGGGRLYALAEPWCGDCAEHLPLLARLADAAGVPLVVFRRDADPALRQRHLTGGRARIPLVVAVDGAWQEVGRFVERPAALQQRLLAASAERKASVLAQAYAQGTYREATLTEFSAMIGGATEAWEAAPAAAGTTVLPCVAHPPVQATPTVAVIAAHGASYDMEHPLSRHLCQRLAQAGVGAVRFNFGYRARGQGRPPAPDEAAAEMAAVVTAVQTHWGLGPERIVLAGKSVGALAAVNLAGTGPFAGVVAFGLPLHNPEQTWMTDLTALRRLEAPVLWFSGDRDPLAAAAQVQAAAATVSAPLRLEMLPGADHSLGSHLHLILDATVAWVVERAGSLGTSS